MTRNKMIERTITTMQQLPKDKVFEISDFVDFVFKRYEATILAKGIQKIAAESPAFDFLSQEEDVYSVKDLKEVYHG